MTVTALPIDQNGRPTRFGDDLPSGDQVKSVSAVELGDWVRAEPFRAQLRHVMAATGLPWRALSRLAGAEPHEVQQLLQGGRDGRPVRKIRLALARRLFALTTDNVLVARRTTVRADLSVAALTALLASGWTFTDLSTRLRMSAGLLRALAEGRRGVCSRLVEVRILAAAEVLNPAEVLNTAAPEARSGLDRELAA